MLAVETENLTKIFTERKKLLKRQRTIALEGVNLEIKKGELFGLLGPNGAGKTTFINIISTLLLPDRGHARVFGFDVQEEPERIREIINICSAFAGFYDEQTVKQNLQIYSMMYGVKPNIKKLISQLWLEKYENEDYINLSSGNRQRVSIAKSLLNNPRLLLMDEPTVGLDPEMSIKVRHLIESWKRKHKTTVILSTHNMYEADELCDRIAIIYSGKIVACDTSKNLKKLVKEEDCIEIEVSELKNPARILSKLEGINRVNFRNYSILVYADEAEKRLQKIIKTLLSNGYHIKNIKIREPTLEDVFIKIVGARLE